MAFVFIVIAYNIMTSPSYFVETARFAMNLTNVKLLNTSTYIHNVKSPLDNTNLIVSTVLLLLFNLNLCFSSLYIL